MNEIEQAILELVQYGIDTSLIEEADRVYTVNALLQALALDEIKADSSGEVAPRQLNEMLEALLDYAVEKNLIEDHTEARDLFDTKLMGLLTPPPRQVRHEFYDLYDESAKEATDWYYAFSQETNYIRRDRMAKNIVWQSATPYGELDITINLAKPEKDPKAIAAAKNAPQSSYPKCLLCKENEGYAGHIGHPARQNHRIIPITINETDWFFQYSPYTYYNEHCIVFNAEHVPMKIDRAAFRKLFDFVTLFPHYFVGSNADLPIVGGSILSHDHFQGGRYTFAMERAEIAEAMIFKGYENVRAGRLNWPLTAIRLTGSDDAQLVELADKILGCWRGYTDESAFIFAETEGEPHNTITPIVRRAGDDFQIDLVLRNNITTAEYPLGVYHPHQEYHHIKKENIGLIEVMGLAVLPARLVEELALVAEALIKGSELRADERTAKHADWAEQVAVAHPELSADNVTEILRQEVGIVFGKVLADCGVFKDDAQGQEAFRRFVNAVNEV